METVLLVEDKAELREMLVQALTRMDYQVSAAATSAAAAALLRTQRFSAVLTDLKLPSGTGMEVLRAALEVDAALPVIIMTAYGTIVEAVAAMREGAYDFIQKPIDLEHLRHLIGRALERQQLLRENLVLKDEYARKFGFPRIVGEHPSMQSAAREMQAIAATDTTVLLLGASGTGKELFARAIHQLSPRSSKPFLALNCAAIPESLVENELFGHERGAFTGADSRQAGKFELAHAGTLFLDEIGELPLSVQSKLLRVLEDGKVQRLGSNAESNVNVRVITATNRDLEAAVKAQAFRQDLYYRLAVFTIRIPGLRERGDDVLLLAEHFLSGFRRELKKPRLKFSVSALQALGAHSWPGNVRELRNAIERASILCDSKIEAADLALPAPEIRMAAAAATASPAVIPNNRASGSSATALPISIDDERGRIEATLRECKWNKRLAADKLGIPYKTLLAKLRSYDLS